MLKDTGLKIEEHLFQEAKQKVFDTGKHTLNRPLGKFFYDKWEIKDEFKNSVWDSILEPIKDNVGEARIIVLDSPSGYTKHADLDDRYHLNLAGDEGYLLDLENLEMHLCQQDGIWYEMDAGIKHSAISIGATRRAQLVVRKLLPKNNLQNPIKITLSLNHANDRYFFDNLISPWLNRSHKKQIISNCSYTGYEFTFNLENAFRLQFEEILDKMPVQINYQCQTL